MCSKIQEIPIMPKEFYHSLKTGRLVIFVGAGVSRLAGYPSWNDLADYILKEIAIHVEFDFSFKDVESLKGLDPKKKLSIAIDIWKSQHNSISELLHKYLHLENNQHKIYELINTLKVPFVTTNYDNELINIINQKDISIEPTSMSQPVEIKKNKNPIIEVDNITIEKLQNINNVIYLHGNIKNESSLIITTKDYSNHYSNNNIQIFLEELFSNYTVLFLGYGLEEEEILEYVIRKKKNDKNISHYRLMGFFSHEEKLYNHLKRYYLNHCNIEIIPFLKDNKNFQQLKEVVMDWIPIIVEHHHPQNFIEKTKLFDEVL